METKLNEKIVSYSPELPITWEDYLSYLLRNHIDKKHGITSIIVDGKESVGIMTDNPKKLLSQDIQLIEIFTNDSITIAKNGFDKITEIIVRLNTEATITADLYREDKIKEASQNIMKIINAITPVIYFVNSIEKNFNFNFSELSFSKDTSIKDKLDYFTNSFTDLVNSQEKSDFVELADYLEYQFTDDLNDWKTIISLLVKEIENSTAKSN